MRVITDREKERLREGQCPFCLSVRVYLDASGGLSRNVRCLRCGSVWNIYLGPEGIWGGELVSSGSMSYEEDVEAQSVIQTIPPESMIRHWVRAIRTAWKGTKR